MGYVIERLTSAGDFLRRTESFRSKQPMETNVIGSVATSVADGTRSYSACFWWLIRRDAEIVGVAIRTAPYRLVLSPMPLAATGILAREVHAVDPDFWGVSGPEDVSREFIEHWCIQSGRDLNDFPLHMRDTIYVLQKHTPLSGVQGLARKAGVADIPLLAEWLQAFSSEVGVLSVPPSAAELEARILTSTFIIWEVANRPVALSGHAPLVQSPEGSIGRIGPVYTEPNERGNGYGAAVTSAVIAHLTAIGCSTIMLYADSDYAKSNRVYLGLGFRPVGALVELGSQPQT